MMPNDQELNIKDRISQIFSTLQGDDVYAEVLKVLLEVTGSKHGIFGYINEEGAIVAGSMTKDVLKKIKLLQQML